MLTKELCLCIPGGGGGPPWPGGRGGGGGPIPGGGGGANGAIGGGGGAEPTEQETGDFRASVFNLSSSERLMVAPSLPLAIYMKKMDEKDESRGQ